MKDQDVLAKGLSLVGTALVWVPLLAPVVFSAALAMRARIWRFDYLMPAELFLIALIGGALLIWAAIRTRFYQKMIAWAFSIAVFLLVGGQVLAVVTGLASGEIEPTGWPWILVLASLVGYSIALIALGMSGFLLIRKLFRTSVLPA